MRRTCQECGRAANFRRAGKRTRADDSRDLCSRCWAKANEQAAIDKRHADIVERELVMLGESRYE